MELEEIFTKPTEEKLLKIRKMLKLGRIDYYELQKYIERVLDSKDYELMALLVQNVQEINIGRVVSKIGRTRDSFIIYNFLTETINHLTESDIKYLAKMIAASKNVVYIYFFARQLMWSYKKINGEKVYIIDLLGEEGLNILDILATGMEKYTEKEQAYYIFYFLRDVTYGKSEDKIYISSERRFSLAAKLISIGNLRAINALSGLGILNLKTYLYGILNCDFTKYRSHDVLYIFAKNYGNLLIEEDKMENEIASDNQSADGYDNNNSLSLIAEKMCSCDDFLIIFKFLMDVPDAPYKNLVDKLIKNKRNNKNICAYYLLRLAEANLPCSPYIIDYFLEEENIEMLDMLASSVTDEDLKEKINKCLQELNMKLGFSNVERVRRKVKLDNLLEQLRDF